MGVQRVEGPDSFWGSFINYWKIVSIYWSFISAQERYKNIIIKRKNLKNQKSINKGKKWVPRIHSKYWKLSSYTVIQNVVRIIKYDGCGGLVVKESASHAEGPGFETWCRCHYSHLMVETVPPYEFSSRSL